MRTIGDGDEKLLLAGVTLKFRRGLILRAKIATDGPVDGELAIHPISVAVASRDLIGERPANDLVTKLVANR
jgi:hypothetical protein